MVRQIAAAAEWLTIEQQLFHRKSAASAKPATRCMEFHGYLFTLRPATSHVPGAPRKEHTVHSSRPHLLTKYVLSDTC